MMARLVQPRGGGPFRLAWFALAGGVVALTLTPVIGSVGAYLFLVLFALFALAYPRGSVAALTAVPLVWVLPGLAFVSTLWSEAPLLTLRYAAQFALSVGCACLAARHLGPRGLVSALLCGLGAAMVLSLTIGRHEVDPLTGQGSFVGIFGSKNALAGHVVIVVVAAVAALLDARQSAPIRLLALGALGMAGPVLVVAGSAGALVASVAGLAALAASIALVRLGPRERGLVLFGLLLAALPLLALLTFAGEAMRIMVEEVLGKDMTLTGRTVLWQRAQVLIAEHPWLGHGFQAFWRRDYVEAEGLWRSFHMPSRTGFNFHNLYLEAAVGLGWIGVVALVWVLATTAIRLLRRSFVERSAAACFSVTMMAVFLLRSVFEVELLYQFSVPTLVFFALVFQAGEPAARPLRLALRAPPREAGYAPPRHDPAGQWP